jgi:hypothetical protein
LRINVALGFGGGRSLRICTHYLSGLIGDAVRAGTYPCLFEFGGSAAGKRDPGIGAVPVQAKDAAAKACYLGQAE